MSATAFVQQKPMAISTITSPLNISTTVDLVSTSVLEPSNLSSPMIQSNPLSRKNSFGIVSIHSPHYSSSKDHHHLYQYYSTTLSNNNIRKINIDDNRIKSLEEEVVAEEELVELDHIHYSENSNSPTQYFLNGNMINNHSSSSSNDSISGSSNNSVSSHDHSQHLNNNNAINNNDINNNNLNDNNNNHNELSSSASMNNSPLSLKERRQRNKTASAKYRAKKNQQHQDMRLMIHNLTKENDMLIRQLDQMKSENQQLKSMCDKLKSKMMAEKMFKKLLQQQQHTSLIDDFHHYKATSINYSKDIKNKNHHHSSHQMDTMDNDDDDIDDDIDSMDDTINTNNDTFMFNNKSVYNHSWVPEQKNLKEIKQ